MPTNLIDRLGELVDKVTPGPWHIEPQDAGARGYWMRDADGEYTALVCPQNCESHELPNAEFIALCFAHKHEIFSALRKAEEPASGDYAELVERLRKKARYTDNTFDNHSLGEMYREAATAIERLTARLEVVPGFSEDADGIACRDDTIRLQDERIARLTAREAELCEALVQHNERLRSAVQIAARDGAATNWKSFRGQCHYTLAEYHDLVNEARARLSLGDEK